MVRESVDDEEQHELEGREAHGRREGGAERRRVENLGSKEKAIAYTRMQENIERGEGETEALRHAIEETEGRTNVADPKVEKSHERGRPEGERTT